MLPKTYLIVSNKSKSSASRCGRTSQKHSLFCLAFTIWCSNNDAKHHVIHVLVVVILPTWQQQQANEKHYWTVSHKFKKF